MMCYKWLEKNIKKVLYTHQINFLFYAFFNTSNENVSSLSKSLVIIVCPMISNAFVYILHSSSDQFFPKLCLDTNTSKASFSSLQMISPIVLTESYRFPLEIRLNLLVTCLHYDSFNLDFVLTLNNNIFIFAHKCSVSTIVFNIPWARILLS